MQLFPGGNGTNSTLVIRSGLVALLVTLTCISGRAAKTAAISGVVFTLGRDHIQTVWPNARITLKDLATKNETSVITNDLGAYSFTDVLYGKYEISVALAGFQPATKSLTIQSDSTATVDFQLQIAGQSVTVVAEPTAVDLSSSSGNNPTITAKMIKSTLRANQDFQDALRCYPEWCAAWTA